MEGMPKQAIDVHYVVRVRLRRVPEELRSRNVITYDISSPHPSRTLTHRDLESTDIVGTVPESINRLTNLVTINLGRTKLGGTLPDFGVHLSQLRTLDVSNTAIIGAAAGICSVVEQLTLCKLDPNAAWTSGNDCPPCLNAGPQSRCNPPVDCRSTTPAPTPLPTLTPTFLDDPCKCDVNPGSTCQFDEAAYPHAGVCSGMSAAGSNQSVFCDCDSCPHSGHASFACSDRPSDSDHTQWNKFKTFMCFGIDEEDAPPGCFDVTFALAIGFVFAVICAIIIEFILIPVHAAREAYIHRVSYRIALWHSWTHQCWCCAQRDAPLRDENGASICWCHWGLAQQANDARVAQRGYDALQDGVVRDERFSEMGRFHSLRDATDVECAAGDFTASSATIEDLDVFGRAEASSNLSVD